MALRYAVATGNWSNTATWDGGTLPTVGDDVHANGFTVTIDQNITVNKISTKAESPAVEGGGFTLSTITITITSDIEAGTTRCLTINEGTGTINIVGSVYGGSSSNASGVFLNATNSTADYKRPNIFGNLFGGTASGAHAVASRADRGFDPTIYGNVTAGTAAGGISLATSQVSNVTIYGNVLANGAPGSSSGGFLYIYGTSTSSNNNYGAFCANTSYITGIMNNVSGYWAVYSPRIFIATSGSMQFTLNEQTTDNDITLYSQDLFSSPSGSDVRDGITYGAGGALTGSLAVPPSGSVALGVPVDDGVGTAMISITDMGALLASYIV
jgi:hypothetical protein